jgi:hypothetical protein
VAGTDYAERAGGQAERDGTLQIIRFGKQIAMMIRLDLLDRRAGFGRRVRVGAAGRVRDVYVHDPWDAHEYEDCRLEADEAVLLSALEMQGSTTLTVTQ